VTEPFRCSVSAEELGEDLAGSASTVKAFLLVETPGPWGVHALQDSRLPVEVKDRLADLQAEHRIRPLLIRGHGRPGRGATTVFAAYVDPRRPWTETVRLADPRELLDLDLSGLGSGRTTGLRRHPEQLFLVCTHGRHDRCCAERGRPLCRALHHAAPGQAWEVSHIGGDRFAANLLVLPHGLYYGRLGPADATGLVAAHRAGRLDLEHLRGRSSYPFAVQAAEIFLRRHTGALGLEPLPLLESERRGALTRAVLVVDAQRWEVRVRTDRRGPRQLTCRALGPSPAPLHTLLGLDAV
jgi:hypothetical protein